MALEVHAGARFTLYIYIKVLLVLAGQVGGHAGVAARVRDLGLLDPHYTAITRDTDVVITSQQLQGGRERKKETDYVYSYAIVHV